MNTEVIETLTDTMDRSKKISHLIIRSILWRSAISCLGSAIQLEIHKNNDAVELDDTAYKARLNAAHWIISTAEIPDEVVTDEATKAAVWLRNREDSTVPSDAAALTDLGLDAETIEAGRKLAVKWESNRSQERADIVAEIGSDVIQAILSGDDNVTMEEATYPFAVDIMGKAIHAAMVTATARIDSASWSPLRKAAAITELADLVAIRDQLENADLPTLSTDTEEW